jgi:hypothetical protein
LPKARAELDLVVSGSQLASRRQQRHDARFVALVGLFLRECGFFAGFRALVVRQSLPVVPVLVLLFHGRSDVPPNEAPGKTRPSRSERPWYRLLDHRMTELDTERLVQSGLLPQASATFVREEGSEPSVSKLPATLPPLLRMHTYDLSRALRAASDAELRDRYFKLVEKRWLFLKCRYGGGQGSADITADARDERARVCRVRQYFRVEAISRSFCVLRHEDCLFWPELSLRCLEHELGGETVRFEREVTDEELHRLDSRTRHFVACLRRARESDSSHARFRAKQILARVVYHNRSRERSACHARSKRRSEGA